MDVFISYAHVDKAEVKTLVETLKDGGYTVFFDPDLLAGQEWQSQLASAIAECTVFIYVVTLESLKSSYCAWELDQALKLHKPIIPIRLRADAPLPDRIAGLQWVDFTGGATARAIAKLLQAMKILTERATIQQRTQVQTHELPMVAVQSGIDQAYKTAIETIFAPLRYAMFVSNSGKRITTGFRELWQKIYAAHICVFDLSEQDTKDTFLELGIAITLNKPILITAKTDTYISALLNSERIVYYDDLPDLSAKLSAAIEVQELSKKMAIADYCHLCDNLTCVARNRVRNAKKYLVITDTKTLWRPILSTIEQYIAQKESALPGYSSDVVGTVCDLRELIHGSQFAICNLSHISRSETFVMLGMTLGHLTPWFLLYQRNSAIPDALRRLSLTDYSDLGDFRERGLSQLNEFLETVYPPLVPQAFKHTQEVMDWQYLATEKGSIQHRSSNSNDPILGDIEIIRYRYSEIEATHYLHPRTHELIFGRKEEKGVVTLRSQDASREHFKISMRDGHYFVEDLGSTNGTFLNKTRIPRKQPVEIFFKDKIVAGDSQFLIWDGRDHTPSMLSRAIGATATFGNIIPIKLDIEPPANLNTLNQDIILRALYSSDAEKGKTERECTFQVEAYYPLGQVLTILVSALKLPRMTYFFAYDGVPLQPNDTILKLDIKRGSILHILPDDLDWSLQRARQAVSHCIHCLSTVDNKPAWRPGYEYQPFETVLAVVYTERTKKEGLPDGLRIRAVECPSCKSGIQLSTLVALKTADEVNQGRA